MKKTILSMILAALILPSITFQLGGGVLQAQVPVFKQKKLAAEDSTFNVYLGKDKAVRKWCMATLYNPHDTLTDSAAVYHVTRFEMPTGERDSVYNRIGFKKWNTTANSVQNDTVYYIIKLAAGESMDVFVWRAYPEGLYWDMYNRIFDPDRELWVRNTFIDE